MTNFRFFRNRAEWRNQLRGQRPPRPRKFDLTKIHLGTLAGDPGTEERCYAKSLGNCAGGLSREHYISHTLLRQFSDIQSQGVPWFAHLQQSLDPSFFITKCLCQRHNNFLSPLDQLAGQAFPRLINFGKRHAEVTKIPGQSFERWLLKILLGMLSTKKIVHNGKTFLPNDLGPNWIEVLFGLSNFPPECGLYIVERPGNSLVFEQRLKVAAAFSSSNDIIGLSASVSGFRFYLTVAPPERAFKIDHPSYKDILHRPRLFQKNRFPQKIEFVW